MQLVVSKFADVLCFLSYVQKRSSLLIHVHFIINHAFINAKRVFYFRPRTQFVPQVRTTDNSFSHAETWVSKVVSWLLKCLLLIADPHVRSKAANPCSTVLFEATNKISQNSSRLQNSHTFALVRNANVWLSSFRYCRFG